MERVRAGFGFITSSYKRVAALFVVVAILLILPVTLGFLGQQQDIRQRASEIDSGNSATTGKLIYSQKGELIGHLFNPGVTPPPDLATQPKISLFNTQGTAETGFVVLDSSFQTLEETAPTPPPSSTPAIYKYDPTAQSYVRLTGVNGTTTNFDSTTPLYIRSLVSGAVKPPTVIPDTSQGNQFWQQFAYDSSGQQIGEFMLPAKVAAWLTAWKTLSKLTPTPTCQPKPYYCLIPGLGGFCTGSNYCTTTPTPIPSAPTPSPTFAPTSTPIPVQTSGSTCGDGVCQNKNVCIGSNCTSTIENQVTCPQDCSSSSSINIQQTRCVDFGRLLSTRLCTASPSFCTQIQSFLSKYSCPVPSISPAPSGTQITSAPPSCTPYPPSCIVNGQNICQFFVNPPGGWCDIGASPTPTPPGGGIVCAEVITYGENTTTHEIKQFPNSCLPAGWIPTGPTPTAPPIACPQLAQVCPDGSTISPQGSNCTMPACPGTTPPPTPTPGLSGQVCSYKCPFGYYVSGSVCKPFIGSHTITPTSVCQGSPTPTPGNVSITNCTVDDSNIGMNSDEVQMSVLINQYRQQNGLTALTPSLNLTRAAAWLARDMGDHNYFAHTDSLGRNSSTRIPQCGYADFSSEIIGSGNASSPDQMLANWKTAPTQNSTLLDHASGNIPLPWQSDGIAQYKTADGTYYWVVVFGKVSDGGFVPSLTPTPNISATPIPDCPLHNQGDANCDGKVDTDDFNIWRDQFVANNNSSYHFVEQSYAQSAYSADFNRDNKIDTDDFNIWRDGYLSLNPTATQTPPTNTPTPATTITPTPVESSHAGTILASPASENVTTNTTFTVDVVIKGNGTAFNAAQANVAVSSNLQIVDLQPATNNSCGFTYLAGQAPTTQNPSFIGAILNTSATSCTAYTLTLKALSAGTGTLTFSGESITSYLDSSEIFNAGTNGSFNITDASVTPSDTPTPTIEVIPTASPTPTP